MNELLEQVQSIFRDILDQPELILTRESTAYTVEDWDSLAHVNIVTAVERRFKIKFALSELQALRNVGEMLDLIEKKQAQAKR
jgi:acyl carrier protein